MESGSVACTPIEGEEIPTYEDFSVFKKIFRIAAIDRNVTGSVRTLI